MSADLDKDRPPFEPKSKRKKVQKARVEPLKQKSTRLTKAGSSSSKSAKAAKYTREDVSIPEVVSRRMLKRMIFFSGIPVSVGIFAFFASYVIITQGIADLPNVAVLLTTLACFGLSVVGLSYGALSASWEEDSVGTLLGTEQFQVNFERLMGSWRQAREEQRNKTGES